MISSVGYSDTEIIQNILHLYVKDRYFELDPCFSKGNFYKKLMEPLLKFDIFPQRSDVIQMDVRKLLIKDNTISSIMFDPPFIIGIPSKSINTKGSNKIFHRFSGFKTKVEQEIFYKDSLRELYRVLKPGGILSFKCQDTVSCGKQYIVHNEIINMAKDIGFRVEDLFILISKHRLISSKWKVQRHSRKYHCYYIVFLKD